MKFFLLTLGWLLVVQATAQNDTCTLTLSGRVIDQHDHQPLAWSSIWIEESGRGAVADSTGEFTISGICPGTYTVTCSHVGCEPVKAVFVLTADTSVVFTPEHHAVELHMLQIISDKPEQNSMPSETVIAANGGDGDAARALTEVSGLTLAGTGSTISKPVLHGMQGERLPVLQGGSKMETQQWGSDHGMLLDPFAAEQFRVIKGAGSVRYTSDALAGLIIADPRRAPDTAGVTLDLFSLGASNGYRGLLAASGTLRPRKYSAFSAGLQGRINRGGNYRAPHYYLDNTGLYENSWSAFTGIETKTVDIFLDFNHFSQLAGIFERSHAESREELHFLLQHQPWPGSGSFSYAISQPWQENRHQLLALRTAFKTGLLKGVKLELTHQLNRRTEHDSHEHDHGHEEDDHQPEAHLTLRTLQSNLAYSHKPFGKYIQAEAGITGRLLMNHGDGAFLIPDYHEISAAAYYLAVYQKRAFSAEAGIRYERRVRETEAHGLFLHPVAVEYEGPAASAGVKWQVFPWEAGVYGNIAWRAPSPNELFSNGIHHGAARYEVGNPNLNEEKAYSVSLPVSYRFGEHNRLSLMPYLHYFANYIFLKPQGATISLDEGTYFLYGFDQAEAMISGTDLDWSARFNRTLVKVNASWLHGLNLEEGNFLPAMPPARAALQLRRYVTATWLPESFFVQAGAVAVARQQYHPGQEIVHPPEGYYTISARTGGKLFKRLAFEIFVENLTNNAYRDYLDAFRFYADAMGFNTGFILRYLFVR